MQIQAYTYLLKSQTFFALAGENCLHYIFKETNNDGERKDEKCYNTPPDAKTGTDLCGIALGLRFYKAIEKPSWPLVLGGT
jgi:hypothetical protein